MQLVAYGAQDVYLTGNPQITFFKVVYRRHTNFSIESILQVWEGGMAGHPTSNTATIRRNGDLVYRMWLEVIGSESCSLSSGTVKNPGTSWIKYVELEIGGQRIDKHSGDWLDTYYSLTQPNPTGCSLSMDNTGCKNIGTLFVSLTLKKIRHPKPDNFRPYHNFFISNRNSYIVQYIHLRFPFCHIIFVSILLLILLKLNVFQRTSACPALFALTNVAGLGLCALHAISSTQMPQTEHLHHCAQKFRRCDLSMREYWLRMPPGQTRPTNA